MSRVPTRSASTLKYREVYFHIYWSCPKEYLSGPSCPVRRRRVRISMNSSATVSPISFYRKRVNKIRIEGGGRGVFLKYSDLRRITFKAPPLPNGTFYTPDEFHRRHAAEIAGYVKCAWNAIDSEPCDFVPRLKPRLDEVGVSRFRCNPSVESSSSV